MEDFENLQQTSAGFEDDDLDEDMFEEDAGESPETAEENTEADSAEAQEQTETDDVQQTTDEEMFPEELVVFGEKKQVTMAEAKNLIQKGLSYDRSREKWENRLNRALSDPRLSFVDRMAAENGMDTAAFMQQAHSKKGFDELVEQYGDLDNVPKNILDMFVRDNQAQATKMQAEIDAIARHIREEKDIEEFEAFMEAHPELSEIPHEVIKLKAEGHSLNGAFAIVENKRLMEENAQLKKEIGNLKQNFKNKKTSLPSSESKGAADDDEDWFE